MSFCRYWSPVITSEYMKSTQSWDCTYTDSNVIARMYCFDQNMWFNTSVPPSQEFMLSARNTPYVILSCPSYYLIEPKWLLQNVVRKWPELVGQKILKILRLLRISSGFFTFVCCPITRFSWSLFTDGLKEFWTPEEKASKWRLNPLWISWHICPYPCFDPLYQGCFWLLSRKTLYR